MRGGEGGGKCGREGVCVSEGGCFCLCEGVCACAYLPVHSNRDIYCSCLVVKDTRSSSLGLHNLKSMWLAQGSFHLPKFKISASKKNLKGVKNLAVLYVMIP